MNPNEEIARTFRLLIVDDDKMNGSIIQKRLQKRDYHCDYVSSGEECLEVLKTQSYDLILLDVIMPGLSGLEVLQKIREEKNNFELPIIMVTAKDETSDIVDALQKEANDYLTKPVNMDIAVARIETQIRIKFLFEESIRNKQMNTINTMVTTLNHEINNPLAIAIGNLTILKGEADSERLSKALSALDRITQLVKKIEKISNGEIEEVAYSDSVNMYKVE